MNHMISMQLATTSLQTCMLASSLISDVEDPGAFAVGGPIAAVQNSSRAHRQTCSFSAHSVLSLECDQPFKPASHM